jgi:hypothetical protein
VKKGSIIKNLKLQELQEKYEKMMEPHRLKLIMSTSEWVTELLMKSEIIDGYCYDFSSHYQYGLKFRTSKGTEMTIEINNEEGISEIIVIFGNKEVVRCTPKYPDFTDYIRGFVAKDGAVIIAKTFLISPTI